MNRKQLKSVVLAALMVLSVVAFTGVGSAATTSDLSLSPTDGQDVQTSNTVTYDVVLGTADSGVGAINYTVSVGNTSVATITDASLDIATEDATLDQESVSIASDNSSVTAEGVASASSVSGSDAVVGTVTVEGANAGEADLDLSVGYVTDVNSNDYTINAVDSSVNVTAQDDGQDDDSGTTEPDYDATYDKNALDGQVIFQGQIVGVNGFDANERVQLRTGTTDDSTFEEYINANDNGVVEVDTSDYDGSLVIRDSDGNNYGTLEVTAQDVSFEFTDDSVEYGGASELEFVSDNRGEEVDLVVSSDSLDADELTGVLEGASVHDEDEETVLIEDVEEGDVIDADFHNFDAGDYEFTVSVEDTTAEDTASITVNEQVDTDATFQDRIYEQNIGDVAEFTVDLTGTNSAVVELTDDDEDYTAELLVEDGNDDDSVTVQMNSYRAGHSDAYSVADSDDSVTVNSEQTLSAYRLASGSYDLTLSASGEETDVATLSLTTRQTVGVSTLTAPASANFADPADFEDATERSEVAIGDNVAVEVEASGIFGYLDDAVSAEGLNLTFTEQDPGQYQDANVFTAGSNNVDLVHDAANDTFYAIVDAADLNVEDGDEYEVTFEISDENPYVEEDQTESVSTSITFQDRTSSFDVVEEPYQVLTTDNAEVRGTSTLAPGSEITVQALRSGDFLRQDTGVVVSADGTWNATFDFSDRSLGEEFELSIKRGGDTDAITGIFAEEPEWETSGASEELQQRVDELNTLLNETMEQLNSTQDMLDEKNTTIEDLRTQLEEANGSSEAVENLQSMLDEKNTTISQLEVQLDNANQTIANLESVRDSLENEASTYQNQTETLQSQLDDANATIEERDSTISDLESEVSDLESQLEDAQQTTTSSGPGFTAVIALVALMGAALLAVRRQQ